MEEINLWYEEGHGLSDSAQYKKKLDNYIRRKYHDLKDLNISDIHEIKDYYIREEMIQDENMLNIPNL